MKKRSKTTEASSATAKTAPQPRVDKIFLTLVLVLMTLGLVMLFSASYAYAYYYDGNSYEYILKQLIFAVIGLGAMYFFAKPFQMNILKKLWVPILAGTLVLLGLVFLFDPVHDAHRLIRLGIGTFQPSEIAKLTLIICFAHFLDEYQGKKMGFVKKIAPYVIIMGLICGMVVIEPHLSATLLLVMIGGLMILVGDGDRRIWIALFAMLAIIAVIFAAVPDLASRAMTRITPWLESQATLDPDKMGYQTKQSLYAIASGGLFGVGLGRSRQKHLYLPEPQNDFIFAIWCEELGLIGAAVLIVLFVLLIARGFKIAMRAKNNFNAFVVMGICIQVGVQTLFNIAVVSNTIPNTGIGLPFFSSGGTQLVMLLAEMGLVLNVSKSARLEK